MEGLLSRLTTLAVVLGFWAIGYLVRIFAGVKNVRKQMKGWNWPQFWDGIFDRFCWLVATVGAVVACEMLKWLMPSIGITFSPEVTLLLDTASVIAIPFVNGVADLVLGIKSIQASSGWGKNVKSLEASVEDTKIDYDKISGDTYETVGKIVEAVSQSKESVRAQKKFEAKGGRGAYYSVPIGTYNDFRAATLGKGFDIDGAYGFQCFDLCAVLWQQIGRNLLTGNGCAYGCWTLKRDVNAGSDFELITSKEKVKRGDVVVFRMGQFGHIGFADEDYNGSVCIKLLGQNQGGVPYPKGGSYTNVVNVSMATFLGAFRFKKWATANAQPQPEIKPQPKSQNSTIDKGDYVEVVKFVDYKGVKLLSLQTSYLVADTYDDNTVLLVTSDGEIYARMWVKDVKKVDGSSPKAVKKETEQRQNSGFKVGDKVRAIRPIDVDGRALRAYDSAYSITQITNGSAVLTNSKGGIWARIALDNLEKV